MERNELKLAFLTMAFVLGTSPVMAAQRYTEVWNPPEAKSQSAKSKAKTHAASRTAAKKKARSVAAVKQIADKAAIEAPTVAPRAKAASPRQTEPVIPRKIEPNGQVMQV
jgi:type II secretory pathway component PulM